MAAENLIALTTVENTGLATTSYAEVHVLLYDASAGTFTEETVDANDAGTNDFPLIASLATEDPVGDITYFICMVRPSYLRIDVGTAGAGYNNGDITWKYSKDGALVALAGVSDGTDNFKTAGTDNVTFTIPTDITPMRVNGIYGYVIAAEFTDTGNTLTTRPLGDQVWRGGQLAVTPYRVRWTAVDRDDECFMSKARTLSSDDAFVDYFSISIDATATNCWWSPWLATDAAAMDSFNDIDVANKNAWAIMFAGGTLRIWQLYTNVTAGNSDLAASGSTIAVTNNNRYWCKVTFAPGDGAHGTMYLDVYYDRARQFQCGSQIFLAMAVNAGQSEPTMTKWSSGCSRNLAASTDESSGVSGEYYLNEPPPSMGAETETEHPINWTDQENFADFPTTEGGFPAGGWTLYRASTNDEDICQDTYPGTSDYCAKITADEPNNKDMGAYHAAANTMDGAIMAADCYVSSLGDGKERVLYGLADDGVGVVAASLYRVGSAYYFRLRTTSAAGATTTRTWTAAQVIGISMRLMIATPTGSATAAYRMACLYLDDELILTLQLSADLTVDKRFVGNIWCTVPLANQGGVAYVKEFDLHDGLTWGPKLAYGQTADSVLVYAHRVTPDHMPAYGVSFLEIWKKATGESAFSYQGSIGPTALYDYAWLWPIWADGSWFWFEHRRTSTAYQTRVYKTASGDFQPAAGDIVATFDDKWVFPSRLVESGHILVGVDCIDKDADGVPPEEGTYPDAASQYSQFAKFDIAAYTLDDAVQIATADDIGSDLIAQETMVFRDSDGWVGALVRRQPAAGASDRDEYLYFSTDGEGATWPALSGVWPGEDWSDNAGCVKSFLFAGYGWAIFRDSQVTVPWQLVLAQTDARTFNIIAEKTWVGHPDLGNIWEVQNGDLDASYHQSGTLRLTLSFNFGIATICKVSTGLSAGPSRVKARMNTPWANIKAVRNTGAMAVKEITGVT